MRVNHESPIPLYYQLREQIRENILSGRWEYGKELPTELQLCESLNLSRATVKQAMDGLVQEGMIERKKGRGTFVTYQKTAVSIFTQPSLTHQVSAMNLEIYSRVLSAHEGTLESDILGYFDAPATEEFCKIKRVRYIENKPVAIDENYIKKEWARDILKKNLNKLAVYDYLEEVNQVRFDAYRTSIHPILFTDEEKQLLGLEDDRLQFVVFKKNMVGIHFEVSSFYKGQQVMFNRRIFNGSQFCLTVDYNSVNRQFYLETSRYTIPGGERK